MDLYQQEQTRDGAGGNSATQALRQEEESSYQKKAVMLLNDENCYKFIVVSMHGFRFLEVVKYTARNTTNLMQVVDFIGLMQVVESIAFLQVCRQVASLKAVAFLS